MQVVWLLAVEPKPCKLATSDKLRKTCSLPRQARSEESTLVVLVVSSVAVASLVGGREPRVVWDRLHLFTKPGKTISIKDSTPCHR